MNTLGARIKHYRKMKGLTQKQLADLLGVKHNSISDWENDKNKPYADTIENLMWALDVTANELLGWDNPENIRQDAEALANKIIANPKIKKIIPMIADLGDSDLEFIISAVERLSNHKRSE